MAFDNLYADAKAALIGTFGSGVSTLTLLPLTGEFVKRQVDLQRPRKDFLIDTFNPKLLLNLYRLSGRAMLHCVMRSFTSLGVSNVLLQRSQGEESAATRGFVSGAYAGVSQAILTTWFSHSLIAGLSNRERLPFRTIISSPTLLNRVYLTSLVKNVADQGIALMITQILKQCLSKKELLNPGPMLSFVSGGVGALIATALCMPLIAMETNVLSNPRKPLKQWFYESGYDKNPRLFWRGSDLRMFRSSIGLAMGLSITDWINKKVSG